jgi:hypothetical protein
MFRNVELSVQPHLKQSYHKISSICIGSANGFRGDNVLVEAGDAVVDVDLGASVGLYAAYGHIN